MNYKEYQESAKSTAVYPAEIAGFYPLLGLVGETGEIVEKILNVTKVTFSSTHEESNMKIQRMIEILKTVAELGTELEVLKKQARKGEIRGLKAEISGTPQQFMEIKKELGDQMWYQSATCSDFEFELEDVAQSNIDKLKSRQERGVLTGSGDNR